MANFTAAEPAGMHPPSPEVASPASTSGAADEPAADRSLRKPLWAVVGRGLGVLGALIVMAVIARLLPAGSFGDFNMLLTLLLPMSWLVVAGLNSSAVRLIAEQSAHQGRAAATAATWGLLKTAALGAIATMPLVALVLWVGSRYLFFPLPGDPVLLVLFAAAVAVSAVQLAVADCLYAHHRVDQGQLFTGGLMAGPLSTFLFLAILLGWMYFTRDQTGGLQHVAALGMAISLRQASLLEATLSLLLALSVTLPLALGLLWRNLASAPRASVGETTPLPLGKMLQVSVSLLGTALAIYLVTVLVDVTIAEKAFGRGSAEYDWYFAARRFAFMAFITTHLAGSLAAPAVAACYYSGRRDELSNLLRRYAWLGGVPAAAAALLLLLLPGLLLSTYLGSRFAPAGPVLQILAIAPLFAAWAGLGSYALMVTGHEKYCIAINLLVAAGIVLAGVPAARFGGSSGLAGIFVAAIVCKYAAEWWLTRRLLGVWCHMR